MAADDAAQARPALDDQPSGLSARDTAILEFERQWWKYAGAKEQAIREQFQMSSGRYYQVLNSLIDQPEASSSTRFSSGDCGGCVLPGSGSGRRAAWASRSEVLRTLSRLSRPRADERGVVVPSRVMLVAIVLVAVAAVMYVATTPKDDKPAARSTAAHPSASATAKSSAKPTKATKSAKPSSSPSSSPTPAIKRGKTFVAVFNNSGRVGLASRTAAKVTGKGWKVVGTDNWYGNVPATTVYYPKGLKAAGKVLAADLGVKRVQPSVAPMRGDRLTLILTKDYTG